ncbi:phenylacetate-CoA ligase [Actinokineospora baliensis]|uniref:phenylacetate--CoA ligase family protein n=1 Tax=Actinokineospora baliensis TaxID=547056 RepID=UPI00195DA9B7|nr:phenylacetate--CoA ligase family protein [Actinokineospora baliensis]MBM7774770.1 phenylacetate-CoA ligase [Actinokineospora baliensis]
MWFTDPEARATLREARSQQDLLDACDYHADTVARVQHDKLAGLWERASGVPGFATLPGFADRDLSALPVTTKDRVKDDPDAFTRFDLTGVTRYYESSGSSGRTTPTPRTAADLIGNTLSVAGLWRRALGPDPLRVAVMLPSDILPAADLAIGTCEYLGHTTLRCYPFTTGVSDWDRLVGLFRRYRPQAVFAAPGVWAQWTRLLKQRGELPDLRTSVTTVLLLGEVSLAAQRRRLGADWEAAVLDASYGSTETGTIAATCEAGRLHLLTPGHLVEIRQGEVIGPPRPGATGELITTTLNNHARPLLRYGTGDIVSVGAQPCPCGLALPTIAVHGRGDDTLTWRGTTLSEHSLGSLVYEDSRVTGYLVQVAEGNAKARLVLERDVDVPGDAEIAASARDRCTAAGVEWDDVVVVSQLPAISKAGASQKSWKRTSIARMA